MINFYDIAYGIGVAISAPYWTIKPSARRKVLSAFSQRMGAVAHRDPQQPAVMIHAVSLGEVNATRSLISALRLQWPGLYFILSTTTKTGYDRAQQLYGASSDITLIRYPLDFTAAVSRVLDLLQPTLVVLMELEVWPNFMRQCVKRDIPVILANGRLTAGSFRKYKLVRPLIKTMFRRLMMVCAQDQTYAQRFAALGVPPERILITGTMKFDTAEIGDRVEGDQELADALNLPRGKEAIWVCGSTGPGEEEVILQEYRNLLGTFRRLRLILVPRKPERFDEVAELIESFRFTVIRRSRNERALDDDAAVPPVILGDTMGELRKFYSLADVVFVGRTLVDLGSRQHGSDMIEPAALGKPIIVGPYTSNFDFAMRKLVAADAILIAPTSETLAESVRVMISTPAEAKAMGARAQAVVRQQQGATQRHVSVIAHFLNNRLNQLAEAEQQQQAADVPQEL